MNKENSIVKVTSRKIYNKNPDKKICTLCLKEPKRCKIFSKPGKVKCLQNKILLLTSINILETYNKDVICQNCERFIEAATKFRNKCLQKHYSVTASCSVKRVI